MANIPATDICLVINGGTAAQSFPGSGADSIIANSTWNPGCPDFPAYAYDPPGARCIQADAPTDGNGMTYITFAGSSLANPGVAVRDAARKWGHYDTAIPVYVQGVQIFGAWNSSYAPTSLTPFPANASYTLRIKGIDTAGGLAAILNQGEIVTVLDFNAIVAQVGAPSNPVTYWRDLDSSGVVSTTDVNIVTQHLLHNCTTPNNP